MGEQKDIVPDSRNKYLNTWAQKQEGTLCILENNTIQYG